MSNQKALARKSTSTNTETQDNQFEGRGFTVQKKSDTHTQKSDLSTQLLQAKTFGHSISKLAGQESSSASPQTNGLSIQPKLSIGEPGDRYEQEADRVASVVVQRINAPSSTGESVQREAMPEEEDELQMKPLADSIQRLEDEEEELQMKSLADSIQRVEIDDEEELQMKSQVQRREAIGGGEASTDLESSINSARGGGQAIADNIREPMEVAFGADFSGVKVHTDGQSDQLNRSIQARAFTTGQDVFFRSGEYNPGSRGGQELLAHELTHVVQQNGGAVQRSLQTQEQLQKHPSIEKPSASLGERVIQRMIDLKIDDNNFIYTKQDGKRPSGLGGHQGDHTTPFTSLQDQIANAIEGVTLDDAWVNLYDTLNVYRTLPGWKLSTKWIQETYGNHVEGLLNKKGDINALQTAVTEMLYLRNNIALTSLPKGGHGNAEGTWAGSLQHQERQFQLGHKPKLNKNEVLQYIWKAFDHGRVNRLGEDKRKAVLEQHARTMADAYPQLNDSLGINFIEIADYYRKNRKNFEIVYSPQ
ncbi:DUF4157 domain-containing protein [Nostoc sp. FACHB-892]|uniref:eCIS core domain-containing protein n=1 Tax=Nostoc sp. FACHB-892 TaxID=2692843 RepID=UPI00168975D9|nr:DUF4157 domain-containing protein [Nostoc sp. FACHB-892]MBD2726902.1 DUF4157 domain-containing protein [Nostoc sp. FACHB-892]